VSLASVRLGDDELFVEVLPEVGARLHRVRAFGFDLLRTPADPARHLDDPWFWGSYPLAPWCNRLPTGPVAVAGRTVDLPSNFPDGTAIHGQVARAAWTHDGGGTFSIAGGGHGWPWRYTVRQTIAAGGGRLRLTLAVTNEDDGPMPSGLGIHPWFRDPVDVAIRAARVHRSNLASSPEPEPVSGVHDRRDHGPLAIGLDATWTELQQPPVLLRWPGTGLRATLQTSPSVRYIVAAHLDGVDATAVEPETHAPAGLRRLLAGEPGGLELLVPGETLELRAELAVEREET
jgi:aldose 1-epimerase